MTSDKICTNNNTKYHSKYKAPVIGEDIARKFRSSLSQVFVFPSLYQCSGQFPGSDGTKCSHTHIFG